MKQEVDYRKIKLTNTDIQISACSACTVKIGAATNNLVLLVGTSNYLELLLGNILISSQRALLFKKLTCDIKKSKRVCESLAVSVMV